MADKLSRLTIRSKSENGVYRVGTDADAAFQRILRIVNALTEEHKAFASAYSKNEKSGYTERSVFIPASLVENLEKKLSALQGEIGDFPLEYDIQSVKTLQGTLNLMGAQAQSKAVLKARELGGTYDKATGAVAIPLDPAKYKSITSGGTSAAYISKEFSDAVQISKNLEDEKKQILAERQAAKAQREYEKQEAKSRKLSAWFRKEGESAAAKQWQKELDANKVSGEGEDENKRENFLTSFLKDPLVKILGFFGITVTLLRRILEGLMTGAVKTATEAVRTDTQAQELGITRRQLRTFGIFETAHGLKEGTIAGGIKEMQRFQHIEDIAKNPEWMKTMELLASSAGLPQSEQDKFAYDLANMEWNSEQPDEMLGRVIDIADKVYSQQKDIYGKPVADRTKSLDSILHALESIGLEDTATLFSQYVADKESGIYKGTFKDWQSWMQTTRPNVTGLSDSALDALKSLGQVFNSLSAKIKDITDSVLTRFALSLTKFVDWLDNQRWFMSDEEKAALDRKNKKLNEQAVDKYTSFMYSTEREFKDRYQSVTGKEFTGDMNALTNDELQVMFADPMLTSLWGYYKTYSDRRQMAQEQIENLRKGKEVKYQKASHTDEMIRYNAEEAIEEAYNNFMSTAFTTESVTPTVRGSSQFGTNLARQKRERSSFEKEIAQRVMAQYRDLLNLDIKNMSWEDVNKNPVLKDFLEAYNSNLPNGAKPITKDNFATGASYMQGRNFLANAWNSVTSGDLLADFIAKQLQRPDIPIFGKGNSLKNIIGAVKEQMAQEAAQIGNAYAIGLDWGYSAAGKTWLQKNLQQNEKVAGYSLKADPTGRRHTLQIKIEDAKGNTRTVDTGYTVIETLDGGMSMNNQLITVEASDGVARLTGTGGATA